MIQSKTLARLLGSAMAAVLAVALLAPVASADTPAPGYSQFAGCPSKKEKPTMYVCFRSVVSSGHLQMGNKDTPITAPIVLSGGYNEAGGEFSFTSKGGLLPAKQVVPGGVTGLTGLTWLLEFFGVNALSLYATTELAGSPGPPLADPLSLPIKVHLETPSGVLGKNCYIGSSSNPIKLNLTTGTTSPPAPNKPISGKFPELSVDEKLQILNAKNGTFVDNSFAAPGANGCVLTLFGFIPISINGLVNTQSGLPAAAGTNETVQNFSAELVDVNLVYP
jgi:hypothetical protein